MLGNPLLNLNAFVLPMMIEQRILHQFVPLHLFENSHYPLRRYGACTLDGNQIHAGIGNYVYAAHYIPYLV
tara:strand:- start:6348 stop:6560 length:213 start_codon:yes stop_codon:yes gene_type:complete